MKAREERQAKINQAKDRVQKLRNDQASKDLEVKLKAEEEIVRKNKALEEEKVKALEKVE